MKKSLYLTIAFFAYIFTCYGQGNESFTNYTLTGTSYENGSYTGDNGVVWTYVRCRKDEGHQITGKGLMLRNLSDASKVTSATVTGGIGSFTCKLLKAFTGSGNRKAELFVNGVSQGSSIAWDNTDIQTFTINNINITGDVVIEIRNISARQFVIDDIVWTGYALNSSLTTDPSAITNLDYMETMGPSTEQSIDIEGTLLTSDITINAPTNFQVSLTSGSGFVNAVTIPSTSANGTTTIYTRLIAGLPTNIYNGAISLSSTGVTTQNVAVSGEVSAFSNNCGSESFTNHTLTGTSYDNGSYTGDNGVSWTYVRCRKDEGFQITGKGLMLRNSSDASKITSATVTGGIGSFTCKLLKAFTGSGNRQAELFINGVSQGASVAWDNSTIQTFTVDNINIEGDVVVEIRNISGRQFVIDDIEWTCYSASLAELQLVDNTNTNQDCGYTIDFGSHALASTTDITFNIDNPGTEDLEISTINTTGDFSITSPATPFTVTPGNTQTVTVTFNPSALGAHSEILTINSNDGDESSCSIQLQGNGLACTPTHTVTNIAPTSGPIGTEVTITGSNFTPATTVSFNGAVAIIVAQTANKIIAEVPSGATTGHITIYEDACSIANTNFTLLNTNGPCNGLPDLILTELYDRNSGSLGYIEVYNGTGNVIDLTNYSIRRYGDDTDLAANKYTLYNFPVSQPSIDHNQALYGKIFSPGNTDEDASPDFTFNIDCNFAGGNFNCGGFNAEDIFHLYNGATLIDVFTVPSTNVGYTSTRNTNTTGPNATENPTDWSHNTTESTANLGIFNFSGPTPSFPTIAMHPSDVTSCASDAIFNSQGTPENSGTLSYQWYFNDGSSAGWSTVTPANLPLATVTGETTNQLTLSDDFTSYKGYQFYCRISENDTCDIASDAAQLKIETAYWTTSGWSVSPTIDKIAIINEDYNTSTGTNGETSFEACQCTINTNKTVYIANNTYVLVYNNLTVDGNLIVQTDASFVQVEDTATISGDVLNNRAKITVEKETANLSSHYEYTYWSAPVSGELVTNGLNEANAGRIYTFNAQNYLDATKESNNNNATIAGQDDIDDDGNDWQFASGATPMNPGVGYAATHNTFSAFPNKFIYVFEGPFNNGIYNLPIYRNDSESHDNNWNFIGNPYPSAIDADLFLAENASIDQNAGTAAINGAIFFWSHNTPADGNTNGNQNLNYTQSDYAIINGSGETMGGDMVMPTRHIPSGQGFFVAMDNAAPATGGTVKTTNVRFNNSMRVTGSNNQFFRTNNADAPNKIWVNLTSDNGISNQLLVAYVNGATNNDDGMYFDAEKNLSNGAHAILYSLIENTEHKKYAIQGKNPNSLTLQEIIPLGFSTTIEAATLYTIAIYQIEGAFMTDNTIYLRDNLLNTTHNLSANNYNFTSETGEFNDRFQIIFSPTVLSTDEYSSNSNALTIVELANNNVQFKIEKNLTIATVEILDILGRSIYNFKGHSAVETYNVSLLSKAPYIAKVTLSNGQVLNKKAIKK